MKIISVIIFVVACLWGYGFYKGYSDVENGANLITYKLVSSGMNPVTRHGYKTYFTYFTDLNKRVDDLKDSLDSFGDIFK
ncbi:MAG: hypothetical protein II890_05330 [Spirochaetia bacterium]|nr:hypothetical protein [Spirochaetia bacterium]